MYFYHSALFGFRTYGVHMNGYVRNDSGDVYLWISRRSKEEQTFPGMLDNTVRCFVCSILSLYCLYSTVFDIYCLIFHFFLCQVAGGISSGEKIRQTLIRECEEEAGISEKLCAQARPAGTVRYNS